MAQAKIRNLNTIVNKFYGGMSNDDYVGAADASGSPMSFYDGQALEVKKQAKFISLAQNTPTVTNLGNNSDDVVSLVTYQTGQAICTNNGNIHGLSGTVVKSCSAYIVNSFVFNGYGHVIKINGKIDRWTLTEDSVHDTGVTNGAYATDYATIAGWVNTAGMKAPYTIVGGVIYIGAGRTVYGYDLSIAGYPVKTTLDIDYGFAITGISFIGDRFYIYASDGTSSIQYLWNGASTTLGNGSLSVIKWYDKPIVNIANMNNVDYAVVGNTSRKSFYRVSGYQPELLIQSKFIASGDEYNAKFCFLPTWTNAIETVGNIIYIAAKGCIYAWGRYYQGMPESIVRQLTFAGSEPTVIQSVGDYLIYFYRDASGNKIRTTQFIGDGNSAYSSDPATLILNPIISGLYSNENSALKVRIGYDLPTTDTQINIYSKANYEGGVENFYVSTFSGTFPEVGDVYTYNAKTYTVSAVTKRVGKTYGIIHTTLASASTDLGDIMKNVAGTLTKTSGSGPSTIAFYRSVVGMDLIGTADDITRHKELFETSDPNFQITYSLDLISWDSTKTPRLWDFVYSYNEIENDI